jgi:hypothetical protein
VFDAVSLLIGLAFGGAIALVAGYLRSDRPVLTSRRLAIAVIGTFLSVGLLGLGAALSSGLLEVAAVPLGFALAYLIAGLGAPRPN